MNHWNKFLSEENFIQAWRRINTGTNIYYKKYFREVYLAYELSLEDNIRSLINRIKGMSYEPSLPDKIFMPKPSGLQRPITLLTVEDQIVWQAIVNIIAYKWQEKRRLVENKFVFSNILNPGSIFFFEHWKVSYKRFLNGLSEIYKENKWVAHFDLAAYFDTISHDHIVKLITPKSKESDFAILIKRVLNCWTSEKCSGAFSHGIPQGPIASSCIGELIFLDIDEVICKNQPEFHYLRYVDDIRIFAKGEDWVREGVVRLEELCRNKGLIPQSSKTSVFYAESEDEAIGKHFSLTAEWYIEEKSEEILVNCIDVNKKEIINLSKFKLFLFKGAPLQKYLDVIFYLFEKLPELSDAFVAYLSRLENDDKVISFLTGLLQKKKFPYQYVEGNAWLLLSIIDKQRKSNKLVLRAIRKILNRRNNFYLRYGLLMYLAPFVKNANKRVFNKYFFENSSILQSLLLSNIAYEFILEDYIRMIKQCLIRSNPDAGLVAAMQIAYDNIDYKTLKIEKRLKPIVRNCLIALGIIKSKTTTPPTPFEEILLNRYEVTIINWKQFLGKEYAHAFKILVMSEKAYNINRSAWLCLIDSFNDIIIRAIIRSDTTLNIKLFDNNGKIVKYGCLLDSKNNFCKKYTTITDIFRALHTRRCFVPEAHPYDEKTARRTKPLLLGERNNFYGKLKKGYFEVNKFFQSI